MSPAPPDGQPPRKRRRITVPSFESAFDVADSPSKSRRSTGSRKSSTEAFQSFSGFTSAFQHSKEILSPSIVKARELRAVSGVATEAIPALVQNPENSSASSKSKGKRLSDTFSDFASEFDLHAPAPLKPKANLIKPISKLYPESTSTPISALPLNFKIDETPPSRIRTGPYTSLRPVRPPLFKEDAGKETTSLMQAIPSHPNIRGIVSTPETNEEGRTRLTSMSSHLLQVQDSVASDSPNISGPEKKHVPLTAPILKNDSLSLVNKASPIAGNSAISFTQRAAILSHSVVEQFNNETVNIELSKSVHGLHVSPEKGNKDYGHKFIRGGLAERAQHLLSRAQTSFALWQADIIKQLEKSHRPKEDLRLRILSVLGYTKQPLGSSLTDRPRNAITRCREVLQDISDDETHPAQEGTVVFLFSMHEKVSSAKTFAEEKDVCIWRPWQEVDMPDSCDPFTLLPPTEKGSILNSQSLGGRRTVLLCSRFLVLD